MCCMQIGLADKLKHVLSCLLIFLCLSSKNTIQKLVALMLLLLKEVILEEKTKHLYGPVQSNMPLNKKTTNYSRKFVFMCPDASYQHRWQKETGKS